MPLREACLKITVSLTNELTNFVKAKLSSGRYASSSDVVREALQLMEKTERREAEKRRFLRGAWNEGIGSGDAGEIDFSALKYEARTRLAPIEWTPEQSGR
jgi:antitoxin ParD1/3/4